MLGCAHNIWNFAFLNSEIDPNLMCPLQQFPKWWHWLYWLSPTSWSLRGLFTSQYGDITEEITVFGKAKAISSFAKDYFGYHYDQLAVVAIVLAAFPLLFASLFALCIGKLNFQRRWRDAKNVLLLHILGDFPLIVLWKLKQTLQQRHILYQHLDWYKTARYFIAICFWLMEFLLCKILMVWRHSDLVWWIPISYKLSELLFPLSSSGSHLK